MKYFFYIIPLFIGCRHPESEEFKRQNEKSSIRTSENSIEISKNVIKFETENGVKYVWIEINGVPMRFIFDTGASSICISTTEAVFLFKQGTLEESDILNREKFQDATGRVSEGTKVNLKTVKIGNYTLSNVEALVVENNRSPLLLGQTVFEQFGKIQIDNNKGEISFE